MKRPLINIEAPALPAFACKIRLAQLLLGFVAILLVSSSSAQQGVPGQPGVITAQDVANFSELARQEALSPTSVQLTPIPFHHVPRRLQHMPAPASPALATESTVEESAPKAAFSASASAGPVPQVSSPSPAPSASFLALPDDGRKRFPDTQGAVGSNYLMVTLNSQVQIQTRAGAAITNLTLDGWWSSLNVSNVLEPRVLYDPYSQ